MQMIITEEDIKCFQDNLRKRRKELNISVNHLAEAIGVTRATIYNLENNKIKMSKTKYIALSVVMDYIAFKKKSRV